MQGLERSKAGGRQGQAPPCGSAAHARAPSRHARPLPTHGLLEAALELSPDRAHIISFAITKLLLCVFCKALLYRRPFLKWCLEALWVWERRTRLDFVCEPNHEDDLWPPQNGAIALLEESGHPQCERTGLSPTAIRSQRERAWRAAPSSVLAVVGAVLHSRP